jgi:hypothetical protein
MRCDVLRAQDKSFETKSKIINMVCGRASYFLIILPNHNNKCGAKKVWMALAILCGILNVGTKNIFQN